MRHIPIYNRAIVGATQLIGLERRRRLLPEIISY